MGENAAADTARAYVESLELTSDSTDGTPAEGEEGAIAVNQGAYDGALATGIDPDDRDQWRRSTAQAALAYGLGTYELSNFDVSARLLDTRPGAETVDGEGAGAGALAAGEVIEVDVAGRAGVPDDAVAVMVNIAVTEVVGRGFVTAWDCSLPRPGTSSLNFGEGSTVSNAAIVSLSLDGSICLYVREGAQLILDVTGYFPAGGDFGVVASARLLDTRPGAETVDGEGAGAGALAAGEVIEVDVAGRAGVPDDAVAVMVNIAVTEVVGRGFVTAWDCSLPRPGTSSLNFGEGSTVSNAAIVSLSLDGSICLYVREGAQLILDVTGYFPAGGDFGVVASARLLDTRPGAETVDGEGAGAGALAAGEVIEVDVAGRAGVPDDAVAVMVNIAVTEVVGRGFVTAWDCSLPRPGTSSLNFGEGLPVSNAAIVSLSLDGSICLYVREGAQLIVDINSYFP